ncbi:MAG: hypothetical protein ABIW81_00545 [Terrimesophilobacter sp.]
MNTQAAMDAVSMYLDLVSAPFTLPGSRLLVMAGEVGLTVGVAEYERDFSDCHLLEQLQVFDKYGDELKVSRIMPDRIEFGGAVSLTFSGTNALSLGLCPGVMGERGWSVRFRMVSPSAQPVGAQWTPGLPSAPTASWHSASASILPPTGSSSGFVTVQSESQNACVVVATGQSATPPRCDHIENLDSTFMVWSEWFDCCPDVREDLQNMAAFCWWVLGANIIELAGHSDARAVVPSKIGYVGLWQWDAYFIAIGLRHGAPLLARQQLEIALRFPSADGQLPDVVHDNGVLASSDDLPSGDRDTLRRAASKAADASVPLTKPPLAAWALRKVFQTQPEADIGWLRQLIPVVQRSQQWWFDHSDLDGDGMPEYTHPYSSGLDDSPIFDGALPVESPDLAAYLVMQDRELAELCTLVDDKQSAQAHLRRADATMRLLLSRWDSKVGYFRARAGGAALDSYTVVSLIPLVTGTLPAEITTRLVAALVDETEFAAPFPVPTVARRDPAFSGERMWRGPVWVNINTLLVEGLRASGFVGESIELAEATVALVREAGGPHEYFNPLTGKKATTATTCFGWSAALFIDLAVQLSSA